MKIKRLFVDLESFVPALIAVALAAICSAVMDTLAHHFSISVFCSLNPDWWKPSVSWVNKGFIVTSDAWHLFKSGMIFFILVSNLLFAKAGDWTIFGEEAFMKWYHFVILFAAAWLTWVLSFNLFYDLLLLSKYWSWL